MAFWPVRSTARLWPDKAFALVRSSARLCPDKAFALVRSSARLWPDKAFALVRYVRTARGPSKALAFPRPRRSCKVQRSPRNDSLLRTVLPLQHLTHVRPVVRVNNPIDTPPVNHNIPSQPGISIYQAVLNDQHRPSSCTQRPAPTTSCTQRPAPTTTPSWTQRLDRPQLTSIPRLAVLNDQHRPQRLAELKDSTDLSLPVSND